MADAAEAAPLADADRCRGVRVDLDVEGDPQVPRQRLDSQALADAMAERDQKEERWLELETLREEIEGEA